MRHPSRRQDVFLVETAHGPARIHLAGPRRPGLLVVLGHGAGGGVEAVDLVAVTGRLVDAGAAVARVEQPYRVAGRRAPAPARQLDAAFLAAVAAIRTVVGLARAPLVTGGRSLGARVACRTAGELAVAGVVALSFPLHPPGRPDRSRLAELVGVTQPVLVVQGDRDPFGRPAEFPSGTRLVAIAGADHGLQADPRAVADAVVAFVAGLVGNPAAVSGVVGGRATSVSA
ncbi:MAG TPA: alpha/beta family hydrolase [Mycobacteriales bacterium]|nr:alpha/beta family hydrolase [Mycobacteriales bacterium]